MQNNFKNKIKKKKIQKNYNYKYCLTTSIVYIGHLTRIIIDKGKINVDISFPNAIVDLKYSTINISNPTIITKKKFKGDYSII